MIHMITNKHHGLAWKDGAQLAIIMTSDDVYESHGSHYFNTLGDYVRWRFLFNHEVYIKDLFQIKKMVNSLTGAVEFSGVMGEALCEQRPFGKDAESYIKGIRETEYRKHLWETDFKAKIRELNNGKKTRDQVQGEDPKGI